jgi:hypothetical protein
MALNRHFQGKGLLTPGYKYDDLATWVLWQAIEDGLYRLRRQTWNHNLGMSIGSPSQPKTK